MFSKAKFSAHLRRNNTDMNLCYNDLETDGEDEMTIENCGESFHEIFYENTKQQRIDNPTHRGFFQNVGCIQGKGNDERTIHDISNNVGNGRDWRSNSRWTSTSSADTGYCSVTSPGPSSGVLSSSDMALDSLPSVNLGVQIRPWKSTSPTRTSSNRVLTQVNTNTIDNRVETVDLTVDDLPSTNLDSDSFRLSLPEEIARVDETSKRTKTSVVSMIDTGIQNLNLCSDHRQRLAHKDDTPYWFYILKPDAEGDNVLFSAILAKKTPLVMAMVELIPDYRMLAHANNLRQSALHLVALTDNHVLARRLVVAGAKVHLQDQNGNTPLHIATIRGNVKMAEALLSPVSYVETLKDSRGTQYQAPYQAIPQDLNIRNYQGQTCIILATIYRRPQVLDLLLEKDADINSVDMKTGKTCLHIAAESGDVELVEFITSKPRVNLDAETYSGYTAIELASYRNHSHVVYKLSLHTAPQPRNNRYESESDDYETSDVDCVDDNDVCCC